MGNLNVLCECHDRPCTITLCSSIMRLRVSNVLKYWIFLLKKNNINTSCTDVAWQWRRLCAPQREAGVFTHVGIFHSLAAEGSSSAPRISILVRNVSHGDVQLPPGFPERRPRRQRGWNKQSTINTVTAIAFTASRLILAANLSYVLQMCLFYIPLNRKI